jgi:2-keto-3-deoxygluconate permease
MLLGNLDDDIRQFLKPGVMISIPFFAFPLGAGLSLKQLLAAGPPGILLGFLTVVVTGVGSYFVFKLLVPKKFRKNAAVGAGVGTSAGNAAATPAAFAAADPSFASYAPVATAQVGASIVISAIVTPLLVDFLSKLENKNANTGGPVRSTGDEL